MTKRGLLKELKDLPDDTQIHVCVGGEAKWLKLVAVGEESDPRGGIHAVLFAYEPVLWK